MNRQTGAARCSVLSEHSCLYSNAYIAVYIQMHT